MTSLIVALVLGLGCAQQKVDPADAGAEGANAAAVETPAPEAEPAAEEPAGSAIPERESDADRVSKNGHLVHTVDGVSMDIRFGRPQVKERPVWGALVPYGKVWRTGANEASTISFDKDVTVNGKALSAGVYSLFMVPAEGEWTVIFNKTASQWGAYSYDAEQDALRVPATPAAAEHEEAMNFEGTDTGFVLRWEKVSVPVTVAAAG